MGLTDSTLVDHLLFLFLIKSFITCTNIFLDIHIHMVVLGDLGPQPSSRRRIIVIITIDTGGKVAIRAFDELMAWFATEIWLRSQDRVFVMNWCLFTIISTLVTKSGHLRIKIKLVHF